VDPEIQKQKLNKMERRKLEKEKKSWIIFRLFSKKCFYFLFDHIINEKKKKKKGVLEMK